MVQNNYNREEGGKGGGKGISLERCGMDKGRRIYGMRVVNMQVRSLIREQSTWNTKVQIQ